MAALLVLAFYCTSRFFFWTFDGSDKGRKCMRYVQKEGERKSEGGVGASSEVRRPL